MVKRVVLDTNVLISALGWEGRPREIFKKILNKKFELILSTKQLEEIRRVMNYPRFNFNEKQKLTFLNILYDISTIVEIPGQLKIIKADSDDNIILETALEGSADFIISGDEHLIKLKEYLENAHLQI